MTTGHMAAAVTAVQTRWVDGWDDLLQAARPRQCEILGTDMKGLQTCLMSVWGGDNRVRVGVCP